MKKYLKWIIILIILLMIVFIPILSNKDAIYKDINYAKFEELLKNDNFTFLYIGSPTCGNCVIVKPYLKELKEKYSIDIYYLNISNLSSNQINKIEALDDNLSNFGTPAFIFVKDKKVIGSHIGATANYEDLEAIFLTYYNK
ncbi:MAG TPA: thioredoxin family protein [Bacilli bacterium]|nr:thioredoxin family protein [Bacilli bacterium]